MKKRLVFLENDYQCPDSDDSIHNSKIRLRRSGNLSRELTEQMEIIYQFHLLSKDEVVSLITDSNNILVTYSVYIQDRLLV